MQIQACHQPLPEGFGSRHRKGGLFIRNDAPRVSPTTLSEGAARAASASFLQLPSHCPTQRYMAQPVTCIALGCFRWALGMTSVQSFQSGRGNRRHFWVPSRTARDQSAAVRAEPFAGAAPWSARCATRKHVTWITPRSTVTVGSGHGPRMKVFARHRTRG